MHIPPKNHVGPYQSTLWPHSERILRLRLDGERWIDIANILREEEGIDLTHATICNWFKRNKERIIPRKDEETPKPKPRLRVRVSQPVKREPLQVIE